MMHPFHWYTAFAAALCQLGSQVVVKYDHMCVHMVGLNAMYCLWYHVCVMTDNISCPTHFPKGKTECKVDSLNIYCETLCHNKVYMKNCSLSPTYSIPQNQVICTT